MRKIPQKKSFKNNSSFSNKKSINKNKRFLKNLRFWSLLIGLISGALVIIISLSFSKPKEKEKPYSKAENDFFFISKKNSSASLIFQQKTFSTPSISCQGKFTKALSFFDQETFFQKTAIFKKVSFQKETPFCSLSLRSSKQLTKKEFLIQEILAGTPMEIMAPIIAQKNQQIVAFLIGIALKESGFGKNAPHKNGQDCYNYWGYKGNINPVVGGYSCFVSPLEAVETVSKRIENLINQGLDTPAKMIIWKCGSACQTHSSESKSNWIKDVSINYQKIISLKN